MNNHHNFEHTKQGSTKNYRLELDPIEKTIVRDALFHGAHTKPIFRTPWLTTTVKISEMDLIILLCECETLYDEQPQVLVKALIEKLNKLIGGMSEGDVLNDAIKLQPYITHPPEQEDSMVAMELQRELLKALDTLTPREIEVIEMYYGLRGEMPQTYEEIGKRFGLGRTHPYQVKENAIRRLRHISRSKVLRQFL